MIRKLKPTRSSLHHLGEAGAGQRPCLNTWVAWSQLVSLNTKQWPSLLELYRLNCAPDTSKQLPRNGRLQEPERDHSDNPLHSYCLWTLYTVVSLKWSYAYSCPHTTAKGSEAWRAILPKGTRWWWQSRTGLCLWYRAMTKWVMMASVLLSMESSLPDYRNFSFLWGLYSPT